MNKIFDFLCTYEIDAICNFIILVYGAILLKNMIVFFYRKLSFNKMKLFITICMVRFKEKLFILLGLIVLLCVFYKLSLFYPNKLVDSINTILLSTFTTIFVIDIVNTFQKIQNINFELVKNIFIEKCWNIFVTLHIKENNITDTEKIKKLYSKLPNNNLTPTINDKIKDFKIKYENEYEYFLELFNKIPADIELLIHFVVPNLYKIAVSNELITNVEQFNFELLRLKEKYNNKGIPNATQNEDSINHLLHVIKELWEYLYKEQELFYKK